MTNTSVSDWEGASQLFPFGGDSFGVWLFLIIAIVAFLAVIVRAVQHENSCMVQVVEDTQKAESDGKVAEPEATAVVATTA
jgi:heme exporter protein D